jgi:KaiC/GvpD/RAD55 family RecA-like ATPase
MGKKKKASFFNDDEMSKDKDPDLPPGEEDPFPPTKQLSDEKSNDPMALMNQMMMTMQSMMQAGAMPQQWSSSSPFKPADQSETPPAVKHDIIIPKTLKRGIIQQEGLDLHPLYSKLFMKNKEDTLNGIPKGCTMTLTGPAYSGKTRSALEMMVHAVLKGIKTAFVVAEEGFYDQNESGRNDLFSRFLQLAIDITGETEENFREKYDDKYVIIPNQYHLGKTWSEFIIDYRYAIEELGCQFTIIDSINMLDPSKLNTVDNLNALKTYNHEKGITCLVIGQVKDTGIPQGGEALFHTSEVSIHIYEKSMSSKAEGEMWGAEYRQSISLISARSKVCHALEFPVRIEYNDYGLLRASHNQPEHHKFPDGFWR